MKLFFVTLFDHRYSARGLALYDSMREHCREFHLWVIALTPECCNLLTNLALPGLTIVSLQTLESALPELRAAKLNRSLKEYYYTLSSASCQYVMENCSEIDLITYVDADTYFFSNPAHVFESLDGRSIAITPHNFSRWRRGQEKYGKYNVGWVSFRRDADGLRCLKSWYRKCVEWCYEKLEKGRYADQKYLDSWPAQFRSLQVIEDPGVNLAPWNLGNVSLSTRGNMVLVDKRPLVFFHFADLAEVLPGIINTQLGACGVFAGPIIRWRVYGPYIRHLKRISKTALRKGIGPNVLSVIAGGVRVKQLLRMVTGCLLMQYLYSVRGRIL
jgi:hypothetical protein